jgi:prepilin-type processing-associated H-X9-DG protein
MPRARPDRALRVLQLNAGSLLERGWEQRRHEIVTWVERLDADVVCLQEIWEDSSHPNSAAWIVEQFPAGRWSMAFGGFPFPAELWADQTMRFGSAVLSRWPIDEQHLAALPVDEAHPDPFWRLTFELLHVRTAGLDVFSTHLAAPPAQAYHRLRQVLFLDGHVRDRSDPGSTLPAIVCGDFNAEPDSDEVRFLCSYATIDGRSSDLRDAWRAAVRYDDPGLTQDPRRNPACAELNVAPKRIDYVFVGDGFRRPHGAGQVLAVEVVCDQPLTGVLASDHFGVLADIAWPDRPGAVHGTTI